MSQVTIEQKEHRRKYLWIIILLLILIGILVTMFFPRTANDYSNDQVDTESAGIHGTYTFSSGVGADSTGEFWFDGGKYRITWYEEDGTPRLHMISPDGRQLYHAHVKGEETTISYMPPEMHHDIFKGPTEYITTETRVEGDMDVTYYDLDKLWDIAGATQQFYLKDVARYEEDGLLKKIVARSASSKPDSEEDLITSTYLITSWQNDSAVSSELFELPYPVQVQ